ncbi:unnamed protein product [Urochloa humidicola]
MLRSLLHLSGRLLRPRSPRFPGSPNPPLPGAARSPRPRFLSASPTPGGGARRATSDYDSLIESLCASASDTPVDSDVSAVFDPVSGRIVIQRPPPSLSSTEEEGEEREGEGAGEREGKEKAGVKERDKGKWKGKSKRKGKACASGEKGGKEKVSYECSFCWEIHSQWWGICRYCKAPGTIERIREMVLQCDGGPSEKEVEEGEGAGERDGEEKAAVKEEEENGEGKGKWKRKGRASATGKKGQTSPPLVAPAQKSAGKGGKARGWYVCSKCEEGYPRWWGCCRHCNAAGTLQRSREMVPAELSGGQLGDRSGGVALTADPL